MSFESLKDDVNKNLNPLDFARGFIDSAVNQSLNAIGQLNGKSIEPACQRNDSLATKAGNLAGFIVDFAVLSKLTGRALGPAFGGAAEGVLATSTKMGVAGGLYGGLLTPSGNDRSLLQGRLENALVTGSTFAVMGGVGKVMENNRVFGMLEEPAKRMNFATGQMVSVDAFKLKAASNAIAGGAGGVVDAYAGSFASERRPATISEVLTHAGKYAAFGAGFSALDYGLAKGVEQVGSIPPVRDAYYRADWAIRDAKIEAKRQTYATLNKYDLRHPLQRVGDLLYGDSKIETERVPLTPENNPITSLEKELPQYFKDVLKKEELRDEEPDRQESYKIHKEMEAMRLNFSARLLGFWHGTKDQPGIASYSDAELAASSGATPERVAQIRKALTQSAKSEWTAVSPLTQSLADLASFDLQGDGQSYEISPVMAKATFYGYDERELGKRLSMPSYMHAKDAHYLTPLSWMPYEPTDKLPNLFHGSVSTSLPSLFTERTMLPAKELRLRGIAQTTGESADEEFPRRAVSMTRDFNEAYAYTRHSPDALTHFPIVFGISKDAVRRAYPAGMLEPGEILVDKLRLGTSLATKLGLHKPEITHIYAPDAEVPTIVQMLRARRISGVQVMGFNEIPKPDWNFAQEPPEALNW